MPPDSAAIEAAARAMPNRDVVADAIWRKLREIRAPHANTEARDEPDILADLFIALSTLPPSPAEGWRVVPIEPTPEQIKAIEFAIYRYSDCSARDAERGAPHAYRAMIAAALAAPSRAWTDAEVEAAARAIRRWTPPDAFLTEETTINVARATLDTLPPVSVPSREEIARVINHHVQIEASYDAVGRQYQRVTNADQLADAIIALFTAPQRE